MDTETEAEPEPEAEPEAEPDREPGAEDTMSETEREARLEAQRHRSSPRPVATPSATLPRSGMRLGGQRRAGLMGVLTRAFRRDPGGATPHNERRHPADRGEEPSDFWSELVSARDRDNWLSDLLARASRDDHQTRKKRT